MTEDTKRAIEIIKPICNELGISIRADQSLLYLDEQPIGIGCNSTYATMMEALGYIFLTKYPRFRYGAQVDRELAADIKRYWISRAALQKIRQEEGGGQGLT